jgi:hypothetical protein
MLLGSTTRYIERIVKEMPPTALHFVMGLVPSFCLSGVAFLFTNVTHIWRSVRIQIYNLTYRILSSKFIITATGYIVRMRSKTIDIFQHLVDLMSDRESNALLRNFEFSWRWLWGYSFLVMWRSVSCRPLPTNSSFQTLLTIHQTIHHHIPEDNHLQLYTILLVCV